MAELQQKTGRKPDFKGDGVAVWINYSKETKKQYLTISLYGGQVRIPAFQNFELEEPAEPGEPNKE